MSDLLSSGALLATVLSLFYTLWYPEIRHVLDTLKPKDHAIDSKDDVAIVRAIIRQRVLPLFIGSAAMTIALLPDATGVIVRSADALSASRRAYDGVSALYLLMIGLMIALVGHIGGLLFSCRALLKRLRHEQSS